MPRPASMTRVSILALTLLVAAPAAATLQWRGPDLVYDSVLDVTWTRNGNLWGQRGSWDAARLWADRLDFAGYTDWRLASMSVAATGQTSAVVDCFGVGVTEIQCRDNELGHLYRYGLDGSAGSDLTGLQPPFFDVQSLYWSSNEQDATSTWVFEFANGSQGHEHPSVGLGVWAWAVRDGDSEAVPVPSTLWLLLPALLAAFAARSRREPGRPVRDVPRPHRAVSGLPFPQA